MRPFKTFHPERGDDRYTVHVEEMDGNALSAEIHFISDPDGHLIGWDDFPSDIRTTFVMDCPYRTLDVSRVNYSIAEEHDTRIIGL